MAPAGWEWLCEERGMLSEGFHAAAARAVYDRVTARRDAATARRGGGGGGGGGAGGGAGEQYPEWWTLVWEGREPVPEAWIEQGLRFGEGDLSMPFDESIAPRYGGLCLAQGKNGPCGLLAVLQGVVVSQMLKALEARQGRGAAAAMLKAGA